MSTLRSILERYASALWATFEPLGAWGVLALAAVDSALPGLPMAVDALIATLVYNHPWLSWAYVLMGAVGSTLGSSFLYAVGRKGGELLLEKRAGRARVARIREKFDRHPFLTVMLPAMLPPPAPFKLFVVSAGVFGMTWRRFLVAVLLGRVLRYGLLAVMVMLFGPQIVGFTRTLVREHLDLVLAAAVALLVIWLVSRRMARRTGQAAES